MRVALAFTVLALTALAVPASSEWVGHCVAQDAGSGCRELL